VLVRFSNKSASVLVATDVAARGLDIKELAAVINFELSRNPEVHTHRIGRTGRAGEQGLAISLVSRRDNRLIKGMEDSLDCRIDLQEFSALAPLTARPPAAAMVTLCIDGGRKNKLRPGDILGALTGEGGIAGSEVGRIDLFDFHSYVAIMAQSVAQALNCLAGNRIKGRFFKVRRIGSGRTS